MALETRIGGRNLGGTWEEEPWKLEHTLEANTNLEQVAQWDILDGGLLGGGSLQGGLGVWASEKCQSSLDQTGIHIGYRDKDHKDLLTHPHITG